MNAVSRSARAPRWLAPLGLTLALLAGLALRLVHLDDMEFKEDEHYNFIQSQLIGRERPWPWLGMPTGIYIPNPGLSVWVFAWTARLFGARDPVALMQAVAILAVLGACSLLWLAWKHIPIEKREPWLWAFALAMVNPVSVYLERKLWPQAFVLIFCALTLTGWFKRSRAGGALTWGFFGACIGQIHLSGFFFAAALAAFTFVENRRNAHLADGTSPVRWRAWFAGSALGALPLLPWAWHLYNHLGQPTWGAPLHMPWTSGPPVTVLQRIQEALQLKYWVFWATNAFGLHLGNPLGLYRGSSHCAQLSDFFRYPLAGGRATYGVALAHYILGIGLLTAIIRSALRTVTTRANSPLAGPEKTAHLAAFWGAGALLTLTGSVVRRFYLVIAFPFHYLWAARELLTLDVCNRPWLGRWVLLLIILAQALISASFVQYIHLNRGAPQGDYGDAFHVTVEKSLRETGKPWADKPIDYWRSEPFSGR